MEDPRLTFVDELGKYAIAYTALSSGGPGVALVESPPGATLTRRFRSFRIELELATPRYESRMFHFKSFHARRAMRARLLLQRSAGQLESVPGRRYCVQIRLGYEFILHVRANRRGYLDVERHQTRATDLGQPDRLRGYRDGFGNW
jgi:hypothetical protein